MSRTRLWWQEVQPSDWAVFGEADDLRRERHTALLAALEELSTRGPNFTLAKIADRMRQVGYHDPVTESELRDALDKLAGWGFAEPFRDYAAPVRDYQAARGRQEAWALTARGRGVVSAVRSAVVDARRALQLPRRLLDSVERTVRDLLERLDHDRGLLPAGLEDVRTRIVELQRVTADFYAALARMVQSDVTNDELFGDNRDRVIEALRQFPREYGRGLRRVETALSDLRRAGHRLVVEAAVEQAGLIDPSDQQHWVEERVRRLSDLEAWFEPDGSVRTLIKSASGAVHTLLVAIDRRYSARRRGSDLGLDFRTLARSLHRQVTDADARQVYAAAFGDWPAWHAVVGGEEDVAHGTTADSAARTHHVEVTLREHERHGPTGGRPRKVADTADQRATAVAEALMEERRRHRFAQLLATDGEVRLDHFAGLATEPAVILLQAIEVALERFDAKEGRGQAQADRAGVVVRVRPGEPGEVVSVELAEGMLTGPDLRVSVTPVDTVASGRSWSVA